MIEMASTRSVSGFVDFTFRMCFGFGASFFGFSRRWDSRRSAHPTAAVFLLVPLLLLSLALPAVAQDGEDDLAVRALLQTNPSTPAEMVDAASILADLDRPDLAREFLKKVLDAGLDKEQLLALREELGGEVFLSLAGRPKLAPEARTLSAAVLEAFRQQQGEPPGDTELAQRATAVIKQLTQARRPDLLRQRAEAMFNLDEPIGGVSEDQPRRVLAEQFARAAHELSPDDPAIARLLALTLLERAKFEHGLSGPLPTGDGAAADEAVALGAETLQAALLWAMEHGRPAPATAAARLLGRVGTARELLHQGAMPATLVRAALHPDRRVRFAAIEAIIALEPRKPFAGSHHIEDGLAFFLRTRGERRALVLGPNRIDARRLVGLLGGLGFQADVAGSPRELVRMATDSPDYEIALIHAGIANPPAGQLVQRLRYDPRSADLLVDLVARSGEFREGERQASRDPLTVSYAWPHDEPSLAWQLAKLAEASGEHDAVIFVPLEERQQMARRAAEMLVELTDPQDPSPLIDLREIQASAIRALSLPELSASALKLLARTGTPESQTALLELASRPSTDAAKRKTAVDALGRSVERHGILLTTDQLRRQYERYYAAERAAVEDQEIFDAILDYLEAPTMKVEE